MKREEKERKAKKANQMELQQVGKKQVMLQAKTASEIWMDLYYQITEVPCNGFG